VDLLEVLRSTGAIRDFTDEPVGDDVVARILDSARFAPSGGNRQSWHVVVIKDPAVRERVRDLYLPGWYEYLAQARAGLVPFAVAGDQRAQATARAEGRAAFERGEPLGGGFADELHHVPVLLVVLADLRLLATVDRDLGRYGLAGGASVYPFVWSILLAARAEGLGGVVTTMAIAREPEMKALLHASDEHAVAAVVALGHPVHQPTRLRRAGVTEFATVDAVDGPLLPAG
jgi:nitroreductase